MPQLLLELFSEEIPARMQKRAEEDLAKALGEKLKAAGLDPKAIKTFSGPRRLGVVIDDLAAATRDVNEEKKGPRVGSPDQAIQGFLKSAGLKDIAEAEIVEDKKGAFYVARIERKGKPTGALLQEVIPEIIRAFPWPKSMRSGTSDLQWVRPLQNIMCIFGGAHVAIDIDGVPSEAKTWGHRFHAPAAIAPKDFADYAAKLRAAKVEIDREARKAKIIEDARKVCAAKKLELVEDQGLLEEVAGLVEWPVVLLGDMDPAFLDLPGEVIRLSMRTHQKYFVVRDPKTGKLAPHFVTVANVEAKDGGRAIAAGNARVLSARLNDARFFWESDKKTPLYTDERREKLKKIVFHQKLGSVWDKVTRVKALAGELCAVTGADRALVEHAADLCKMDLVTETVGEFPELQGQVGRQLYLSELSAPPPLQGRGQGVGRSAAASDVAQDSKRAASPRPPTPSPGGEGESVAQAIEDHYRPLGPNDRVPTDPVAVTLALADKLDTLVGFWAIDEKPTGSSDPYALRRAALGNINSVRQNEVPANLHGLMENHAERFFGLSPADASGLALQVVYFLFDRLEAQLRAEGKRPDLVGAVLDNASSATQWTLLSVMKRVEALDAFLKSQDGANLLAGYKRAANIIAAEEKKGKWSAEEAQGAVNAKLLAEPAEKALHAALEAALPAARAGVEQEDFADAMKALSALRAPVDEFFEAVLVNADDAAIRRNRLLLLTRFRDALSAVADFSKIEG